MSAQIVPCCASVVFEFTLPEALTKTVENAVAKSDYNTSKTAFAGQTFPRGAHRITIVERAQYIKTYGGNLGFSGVAFTVELKDVYCKSYKSHDRVRASVKDWTGMLERYRSLVDGNCRKEGKYNQQWQPHVTLAAVRKGAGRAIATTLKTAFATDVTLTHLAFSDLATGASLYRMAFGPEELEQKALAEKTRARALCPHRSLFGNPQCMLCGEISPEMYEVFVMPEMQAARARFAEALKNMPLKQEE